MKFFVPILLLAALVAGCALKRDIAVKVHRPPLGAGGMPCGFKSIAAWPTNVPFANYRAVRLVITNAVGTNWLIYSPTLAQWFPYVEFAASGTGETVIVRHTTNAIVRRFYRVQEGPERAETNPGADSVPTADELWQPNNPTGWPATNGPPLPGQ